MSTVTSETAWDELTLSEAEYRRAGARYRQRRSLRAYLFVLPYFIPFVAFLVVPAFWSVWLSFNKGGILDSAKYVGLANWREISNDTELTGAIKNTAVYAVEAILLVFTLAIILALLLNRYRKGSNVFKLALYVPLLAPAVLVGLIWQFMTNFDFGFINLALQALGFDRLNILGSGTLALGTIVLAEVWRGLGFLDALLPRQPAEHPRGAARRRARRRSQGRAAIQADHDPAAAPDAALRRRDRDHRQLPGVRHRVRPHAGRAARVDLDARVVHLETAVPVPGDRPGLRGCRPSARRSFSP